MPYQHYHVSFVTTVSANIHTNTHLHTHIHTHTRIQPTYDTPRDLSNVLYHTIFTIHIFSRISVMRLSPFDPVFKVA